MQHKPELQNLYTAYRSAWRQFVLAVDAWQSERASVAAEQFALAVEDAENNYRKRRNELLDYMVSNTSKDLSNAA